MSRGGRAHSDRGANSGRRWVATCVLGFALLVLIVALIYPTFRRQGQYATLRAHGVTTTARITYCSNTGGSNQTFGGKTTCLATFVLDGTTVSEDLLGVDTQLQTGATVTVVVDPRNPRDAYPLGDVRGGYKSGWLTNDTFIAALAAVLLALTIASQVIVVHRRRLVARRRA
jgi:ABC-type branched-subunit amino acid transport system permease subunit